MAWDVLSGMAKNGMGCFVQGGKNRMGCFVQGGKSLRDVLSGVSKMAWDVLSRDVLSYIPMDIQSEFLDPYASSCYAIFVRPLVLIALVSSSFRKVRHNSRIESRLGCMQGAFRLVLCTKKLHFVSPN